MAINTTSFTNTPQAGDDGYLWTEDELVASTLLNGNILTLDVMGNDNGGNAKVLYSLDDGNGNALASDFELLASDVTNGISEWEKTAAGNWIRINNGKIEFTLGGSGPGETDINSLASAEQIHDQFVYAIRLGNGTLSQARVTLDITGSNDGPVAVADVATAIEAGGVNNGTPGANPVGNVLDNDTDVDRGDSKTVTATGVFTGAYGTLTLNADGSYAYALDNDNAEVQGLRTAGDTLTDTFGYAMRDAAGATSASSLTITITGANDSPVAQADNAIGNQNQAVTIDILANDTDVDGPALTASLLTGPAHGLLDLNANGSVTYTPDAGFFGTDTFIYQATDGGAVSQPATVTITVRPDSDNDGVVDEIEAAGPNGGDANADGIPDSGQPNIASLLAPVGGQYLTLIGDPGTWLSNVAMSALPPAPPPDAGFPLGGLSFAIHGVQPGGSTSVTLLLPESAGINAVFKYGAEPGNTNQHWYAFEFDPGTNTGVQFVGNAVTLRFVDGLRGDADLLANGVIVDPVIFAEVSNHRPDAMSDAFTIDEDTPLVVNVAALLANDTDIDEGDTKTLIGVQQMVDGHGSVSLAGDTVTFMPDADFNGAGGFVYTMQDAAGATSTASVIVTVDPVNDAPVANDDRLYGGGLTIPPGLIFNPDNGHYYAVTDAAGDWSAVSGMALAMGGYLATITSAQENGFIFSNLDPSSESLWIGASDDLSQGAAEGVWKWVTGPEAGTQFWQGDQWGAAVDGQYTNWRPGGDPSGYTGEPNNGNGNENFAHMSLYGYWNDLTGTDTLRGIVEIGGRPGDPDQAPLGNEDAPVQIAAATLLANDTDVDGDALSVTSVSSVSALGAALSLSGDTITYDPTAAANLQALAAGELANDTFTYTVSDGHGGSDTANVSFAVAGANDAPVIAQGPQTRAVSEDGTQAAGGQFTATDVDHGAVLAWTLAGGAPGAQPLNTYGGVDYTFTVDQFDVSKNVVLPIYYSDDFGDGNPPPAGGTLFNGGQMGYRTSGIFTESAGRLIMDGEQSGPTFAHLFTSVPYLGHVASLDTSISSSTNQGLKSNADFTVSGRFDLGIPDENGEAYGIRLSDFISSGPNAHLGDDTMELVVRRGYDGQVRVQFRERDHAAGEVNDYQSVLLDAPAGTDQIELHLSHQAANVGVVTASFEYLDDGFVVGSHSFGVTGRIFGTETPSDFSDDEVWTLAQIIAYSPGEVTGSAIAGVYGTLSIEQDGQWTYQLDNGSPLVQALAEGETVTDTFTATVLDEHGASDARTVNVMVTGTNDAPVITSPPQTGLVREDISTTTSGQLTAFDPDHGAQDLWTVVGGNPTHPADYHFTIDNLKIVKNGGLMFEDTFADGVAPPASPDFANGSVHTYFTTGDFFEIDGRTVMDGSGAGPAIGVGTPDPFVGHFALVRSNIDPDSMALGLKIDDDFTVEGRFDLNFPQDLREAYGIRLTDRLIGGSGTPPDQPGDDAIELVVRRDVDGFVRVQLIETDFAADQRTIIQSRARALSPDSDQIVLRLVHDNDAPGVIRASFDLLTDGVLTNTTFFPLTGQIFGAETPGDPSDDEVWTRAQIVAYAPEQADSALNGAYGLLAVTQSGQWTYRLNNAAPNVQALAENETATDNFTVQVADEHGASDTQQVNVMVTGTNDAPVIAQGPQSRAVSEDGVLGAGGQFTATDVDHGAQLAWTLTGGAPGAQVFDAYSADYLFTVEQFDVSKNVVLPIYYTDSFGDGNPPPAGGTLFNGAQMGYYTSGTFAEAGGRLIMDGAQAGPTLSHLFTPVPYLGHFATLDTDTTSTSGHGLKYNADFTVSARFDLAVPDENGEAYGIRLTDFISSGPNAHPGDDVMELVVRRGDDGLVRVQFFERDYAAGTTTPYDATLLEAPVGTDQIALHLSHQAANLGVVTASFDYLSGETVLGSHVFGVTGQIFGTETPGDSSDDEVWTRPQIIAYSPGEVSGSAINGVYGTLSISHNGQWAYNLDNASPLVQALAQGETATDTFTAQITDEHGASDARTVNVMVTGTNDAPVIAEGPQSRAVSEDGVLGAGGQFTATDVDHGASLNWFPTFGSAGYDSGSILVYADGSWTFYLNNNAHSVQALANDETMTNVFTVRVQDEFGAFDERNVTITIAGENDAPVAVNDSVSTSVNTVLTLSAASLLANDTDVDNGDTKTLVTVQGANHGTLYFDGTDVTFTPDANYIGGASFSYTMRDAAGATSSAAVSVSVDPGGAGVPLLLSQTIWGGSGDQVFHDLDYGLGQLYLAGMQSTGTQALALAFAEGDLAAPAWVAPTVSGPYGEAFYDVAVSTATGSAVFGGIDYTRTIDYVGGKEAKAVLADYGAATGNELWYHQAQVSGNVAMYQYTGVEWFNTVAASVEGGNTYYYAGGGGQPFSYNAMAVMKFDAAGNRVAQAPDPTLGSFSPGYAGPGGSQVYDIAISGTKAYAAGYTNWEFQGDKGGRPDLWTYDTGLALLNNVKDTSLLGAFNGVATLNGEVFAVGERHDIDWTGADYLIEKFDQNGNFLWRAAWGTTGEDSLQDVVTVGGRLYATGYTSGEGAGGYDAVLMEIDPASGAVISNTLFGGANDDKGWGLTTDGANLYVAGESRSFALGGNGAGQSDGLLLKYAAPGGASSGVPLLVSQTVWGGSGDQVFHDVDYGLGRVFLAGMQGPGTQALALAFAEGDLAAPAWVAPTVSGPWGEAFYDVAVSAATGSAVFGGIDYTRTLDHVGGKEAKAVLAGYDAANGDELWYHQAQVNGNVAMYSYTGTEWFNTVTASVEGGNTYYYAGGAGEPFSYNAMAILKFDASGNRVAQAPDPTLGSFSPGYAGAGSSQAYDIAVSGGKVYAVGYTDWGGVTGGRPDLWTYDTGLALQNNVKDTSLIGAFNGVAVLGGDVYAVGRSSDSSGQNTDYLIEKFDQNGNFLWRALWGTTGEDSLQDVVTVGGRLYATGYTNGEGAGGYDAVLMEIDPASGAVISNTLFGGASDDKGWGLTTDGANLYVAGESRSFTLDGNGAGQSDGLLLKYAIPASTMAIIGTNGDDFLVGTEFDDIISGLAGNDNLHGRGGNDTLFGGAGMDHLAGGDGDDFLDGGDGSDWAEYFDAAAPVTVNLGIFGPQNTGGAGIDTLVNIECLVGSAYGDTLIGRDDDSPAGGDNLHGRGGDDMLFGGAGFDHLEGGDGNDLLDGGSGFDIATYGSSAAAVTVDLRIAGPQNTGGAGIDTLVNMEGLQGTMYDDVFSGDAGNNLLSGLQGNDTLTGGDGNDNLLGDTGDDRLYGEAGSDFVWGGPGADYLDGGDGDADTADYQDGPPTTPAAIQGAFVDLAAGAAIDNWGDADTLVNFENIRGSSYADILIGDSGDNRLFGEAGADTLIGQAGADTLSGGAGADRFDYNNIDDGTDNITDFAPGPGGDALDIRDVLVGYDPATPSSFVQITESGGGTTVWVNADGAGSDFVALVMLQGQTGLLLNDLLANNNLLVS